MSLHKRIKGDFTIESVDSGDTIIVHQAGGITIDGDLTVTGTQTIVDSTDTSITDNTIVLNAGELGAGVSLGTAGIEVDRGTALNGNAGIRFNETTDIWEIKNGDGAGWNPLGAGAGIDNVVEDLTPQLGGNLDVNSFDIVTTAGGDIVLAPDTTGSIVFEQDLTIKEQLADETPLAGYNKLYAKIPGAGGTGLYVSNDTNATQDELISKSKAVVYAIIF